MSLSLFEFIHDGSPLIEAYGILCTDDTAWNTQKQYTVSYSWASLQTFSLELSCFFNVLINDVSVDSFAIVASTTFAYVERAVTFTPSADGSQRGLGSKSVVQAYSISFRSRSMTFQ